MKICTLCKKKLSVKSFYRKDNDNLYSYCKECNSKKTKKWYKNNRESHMAKTKERYERNRKDCINLLGGKCKECGIIDYRVLCIDHINGNGSQERKIIKGGGSFLKMKKKIISGKHNYQLLCMNCNWIKAIQNNETRKLYTNFKDKT